MTAKQYAEFTEGQTLTAAELNTLMVHAVDRDRMVGRMAGFGINCGFKGSFAGNVLTITAGLAVDQRGEALVATAARTISFPTATSGTAFDFINPSAGGFSVVVRGDYVTSPPVACTELATCAGHSSTETLGVTYEVVPGRITGPRFAFASEPLLSAEPMRLSITSQPTNDFSALRATLVARLTNSPGTALVDPALITKLSAVTMPAGDLPGVKGYKAAWLNMVLFATLDLLRCRALMNVDCLRTTSEPGVVLGWAELVGSTWSFRCTYRHEWEPPAGLSQALLGGTCGDPCGAFKDLLEGILAGYAPPDPPPAPTTPPPTGGGGGVIIPGVFVEFCRYGYILRGGRCVMIEPPYVIDMIPFPPPLYVEPRPYDYLHFEDDSLVHNVFENYGHEQWNVYDDGVLDAGNLLGEHVENVEVTLGSIVEEHGGVANFQRVMESELESVDGYLPSTAFSPSDGVVLTTNSKGIVIGMGRVPAIHSAKKVGTAIPQALAAGAKVDGAIATMTEIASGVDESIGSFEAQLNGFDGGLKGLQEDFQSFKGGQFDQSGYGVRIMNLESKAGKVDLYGERIATLEGRTFQTKPGGGVAGGIDVDVAKGLAEFTQSTIEAMKSITNAANRNLPRYIAAAERSQGDFEIAAAGGNEVTLRGATVELLDTVRTMVKAGGADAGAARKLDAQFREIQGMLG